MVEILSPATALKDRHTKFDIYQQQKIPYYLLIDVDNKEVEVFKLEDDAYKKQVIEQQTATPLSFDDCNIEMVFDSIWS